MLLQGQRVCEDYHVDVLDILGSFDALSLATTRAVLVRSVVNVRPETPVDFSQFTDGNSKVDSSQFWRATIKVTMSQR